MFPLSDVNVTKRYCCESHKVMACIERRKNGQGYHTPADLKAEIIKALDKGKISRQSGNLIIPEEWFCASGFGDVTGLLDSSHFELTEEMMRSDVVKMPVKRRSRGGKKSAKRR